MLSLCCLIPQSTSDQYLTEQLSLLQQASRGLPSAPPLDSLQANNPGGGWVKIQDFEQPSTSTCGLNGMPQAASSSSSKQYNDQHYSPGALADIRENSPLSPLDASGAAPLTDALSQHKPRGPHQPHQPHHARSASEHVSPNHPRQQHVASHHQRSMSEAPRHPHAANAWVDYDAGMPGAPCNAITGAQALLSIGGLLMSECGIGGVQCPAHEGVRHRVQPIAETLSWQQHSPCQYNEDTAGSDYQSGSGIGAASTINRLRCPSHNSISKQLSDQLGKGNTDSVSNSPRMMGGLLSSADAVCSIAPKAPQVEASGWCCNSKDNKPASAQGSGSSYSSRITAATASASSATSSCDSAATRITKSTNPSPSKSRLAPAPQSRVLVAPKPRSILDTQPPGDIIPQGRVKTLAARFGSPMKGLRALFGAGSSSSPSSSCSSRRSSPAARQPPSPPSAFFARGSPRRVTDTRQASFNSASGRDGGEQGGLGSASPGFGLAAQTGSNHATCQSNSSGTSLQLIQQSGQVHGQPGATAVNGYASSSGLPISGNKNSPLNTPASRKCSSIASSNHKQPCKSSSSSMTPHESCTTVAAAPAVVATAACSPLRNHKRHLSLPGMKSLLAGEPHPPFLSESPPPDLYGGNSDCIPSAGGDCGVNYGEDGAASPAAARSTSPGKHGRTVSMPAALQRHGQPAGSAAALSSSSSQHSKDLPGSATRSRQLEEVAQLESQARRLTEAGDDAAAEGLMRQAVAILSSVLAPKHPNVVSVTARLASCLSRQGKAAEAEGLFRQVLQQRDAILGHELD